MRCIALFVAALFSSAAVADNLFIQTEERSRSVEAIVYLLDEEIIPVCYATRCWLSNGKMLGYRYSVTKRMRDVPTCVAGRGECPEVFLDENDIENAETPLRAN